MISNKHIPVVIAAGLVVLVITAVIAGTLLLIKFLRYDPYNKQDFIDQDLYQAVFLTNDQIYFGHLKNVSSDYLILYDVYYVKVNEAGAGELIKLGAIEPHGPDDKMIINHDQIIFWENIKADSQVTKTIQNMKQK